MGIRRIRTVIELGFTRRSPKISITTSLRRAWPSQIPHATGRKRTYRTAPKSVHIGHHFTLFGHGLGKARLLAVIRNDLSIKAPPPVSLRRGAAHADYITPQTIGRVAPTPSPLDWEFASVALGNLTPLIVKFDLHPNNIMAHQQTVGLGLPRGTSWDWDSYCSLLAYATSRIRTTRTWVRDNFGAPLLRIR